MAREDKVYKQAQLQWGFLIGENLENVPKVLLDVVSVQTAATRMSANPEKMTITATSVLPEIK